MKIILDDEFINIHVSFSARVPGNRYYISCDAPLAATINWKLPDKDEP